MLEQTSILAWLLNKKTETGQPIDLKNGLFMTHIFRDFSPKLAIQKPAQVRATTTQLLKTFFGMKKYGLEAIYTLPTVADANEMSKSKINRLIANNPDLQALVKDMDTVGQKRVGDNMLYIRGCVDEETELLTATGWKRYDEVEIGESLPVLNPLNNTVEMDKVLDMTVFEADEDMVEIKNRQIDQLVTADHRCVVTKRKYNGKKAPLRIMRAHELVGKKSAHIPMRFKPLKQTKTEENPDFYRILGWVVGDGSYSNHYESHVKKDGTTSTYIRKQVRIIQSKNVKELERDLEDAGIKYYRKKHNGNCYAYCLNAKDSRKIQEWLPSKKLRFSIVFGASSAELHALYDGLMKSDGNRDNEFYQNPGETLDAVQALTVLLGRTSSIIERNNERYGKNPSGVLHIKKGYWTNPRPKTRKYTGIAWCPTTRNGTIFIRRHGKVSVTGQTWTEKAAMMFPSDWNLYDEVDSSKQEIIEQYATRLQHSKYKWEHYFSHPSTENVGVNRVFAKSDQKHWFIKCEKCNKRQYLSWPESVCQERQVYQCKYCKKELTDNERRVGEWVKKFRGKDISGYQINLLMTVWTPAKDIIGYYNEKSPEYFNNKVLGLPYVGKGNKVTWDIIRRNVTTAPNPQDGRIIIGADTGLTTWYVVGNKRGIFYYGKCEGHDDIRRMLRRWKNAIVFYDAQSDYNAILSVAEEFPGRVYFVYYRVDRKSNELIQWGENAERFRVLIDRNRMIQLVVDEFTDGRIPLYVEHNDEELYDYWLHWHNIYREEEENSLGVPVRKWKRTGPDHWVHGTILYRTGISKFAGGMAQIAKINDFDGVPTSPIINPDQTIDRPLLFEEQDSYDWRVS